MKKLGYDLYAAAAGKAENQDNNNLYVNGTFDGDRIVSIDSIEDKLGNVLTPEVLGTATLVDVKKVDMDFVKAVSDKGISGIEITYNGDETDYIDFPIDVALQACAEQNLSGNLCSVVITEMTSDQIVYIDVNGATLSYRYKNNNMLIPSIDDNWAISWGSSILNDDKMFPYYLPELQKKHPEASSIESVMAEYADTYISRAEAAAANVISEFKIIK